MATATEKEHLFSTPTLAQLQRRLSRVCELTAFVGCLLTPNQLAALGVDDGDLLAAIMEQERRV